MTPVKLRERFLASLGMTGEAVLELNCGYPPNRGPRRRRPIKVSEI
jgi:hypothetical protein